MHKKENLLTIWRIMPKQESFKQTMIHYIALIKLMDNNPPRLSGKIDFRTVENSSINPCKMIINTVLANIYYLPARQNRHIAPATFSIASQSFVPGESPEHQDKHYDKCSMIAMMIPYYGGTAMKAMMIPYYEVCNESYDDPLL